MRRSIRWPEGASEDNTAELFQILLNALGDPDHVEAEWLSALCPLDGSHRLRLRRTEKCADLECDHCPKNVASNRGFLHVIGELQKELNAVYENRNKPEARPRRLFPLPTTPWMIQPEGSPNLAVRWLNNGAMEILRLVPSASDGEG